MNQKQIKAQLKRAERARKAYLRPKPPPAKPNMNFSPKGKDVPEKVRKEHAKNCRNYMAKRGLAK